jgi:hypothetical protein
VTYSSKMLVGLHWTLAYYSQELPLLWEPQILYRILIVFLSPITYVAACVYANSTSLLLFILRW